MDYTEWKVSIFGVFLLRMRENADHTSSEYGHFSRSVIDSLKDSFKDCHFCWYHFCLHRNSYFQNACLPRLCSLESQKFLKRVYLCYLSKYLEEYEANRRILSVPKTIKDSLLCVKSSKFLVLGVKKDKSFVGRLEYSNWSILKSTIISLTQYESSFLFALFIYTYMCVSGGKKC